MNTENTEKKASIVLIWGVGILSILLGVGIFLYPFISNFFAELGQNKVIDVYKATVEDTSKEEIEAEWEEARIYNENLSGDPVHDPFIVGSGYVVPDNYDEVLNLDEAMCYVEIPKLDLKLPVYHGTSEEVLKKGVGHLEMTAIPIGGENRRTVLTGHRGLPRAELFTRLDEMELGDEIDIHVLDEIHAYKVIEIETVEPEKLQDLTITPDGEDLVTLVTCTPYGVNSHRLLVTGERTEYVPREETETSAASFVRRLMPWKYYIIGIAVVIGVFGTGKITMTILRYRKYGKLRRRRRKKRR